MIFPQYLLMHIHVHSPKRVFVIAWTVHVIWKCTAELTLSYTHTHTHTHIYTCIHTYTSQILRIAMGLHRASCHHVSREVGANVPRIVRSQSNTDSRYILIYSAWLKYQLKTSHGYRPRGSGLSKQWCKLYVWRDTRYSYGDSHCLWYIFRPIYGRSTFIRWSFAHTFLVSKPTVISTRSHISNAYVHARDRRQ